MVNSSFRHGIHGFRAAHAVMCGLLVTNKQNRKTVKLMQENSDVKCAGCGGYVDMYLCTRTLMNRGWLFFCDECANNGTWAKVINKANMEEDLIFERNGEYDSEKSGAR